MTKLAEIQIELQTRAMREGLRTFEPSGSALLSMIDLAMAQSREAAERDRAREEARVEARAERWFMASCEGMARGNTRRLRGW